MLQLARIGRFERRVGYSDEIDQSSNIRIEQLMPYALIRRSILGRQFSRLFLIFRNGLPADSLNTFSSGAVRLVMLFG